MVFIALTSCQGDVYSYPLRTRRDPTVRWSPHSTCNHNDRRLQVLHRRFALHNIEQDSEVLTGLDEAGTFRQHVLLTCAQPGFSSNNWKSNYLRLRDKIKVIFT
ncbi:uncharacterized protein [Periplaneta americana]|uniref:uncharacterized protein n=1 Tax=Periplaneta americana TaxID=6978 RepID=UPI0037E9839B